MRSPGPSRINRISACFPRAIFTNVGIDYYDRVGFINLKGSSWISRIIYGIPEVGVVPAEHNIVAAGIAVIADLSVTNEIKFHHRACYRGRGLFNSWHRPAGI